MSAFDPAARPDRSEYADFYAGYVGAVPDGDIVTTIEREGARAVAMFRALPAERADFAYAPGKWTLREVVAHLADCERVFAYRALSFGRGDGAPLPGFDQEEWMPQAHAGDRPWAELVGELAAVRAATGYLVRSFAPADWLRRGVASDATVTVRALVWVIAGHELHHRRVLAERYGVSTPPVG